MVRPPAPALDVIAARNAAARASADNNASTSSSSATSVATGTITATASGVPASDAGNSDRPPASMTAEDSRDSRSSSSTNSPAPADNEESDFFLGANDSQSSLGVVPNLQDMQVADPECLPTVAALPSEILISIFSRLGEPSELLNCMLTCKRWARNVVEILWHRPSYTNWVKHITICNTLGSPRPFFTYADFIKRINLAALADRINDGSIIPLSVCTRVERLTLTNCHMLTDVGLIPLVEQNHNLMALDLSGAQNITEATIVAIAQNCRKLQGLNITGCRIVANEGLIKLAQSCRFIKRLKLNDCTQLSDAAVLAFAEHCPNILEMDLHQCANIGNESVTTLFTKEKALREFRLSGCDLVDDNAFLSLPPFRTFENLRILDLTSCTRLTDLAIEKIIEMAPRLRNLVVAKCTNLTDLAVNSIAKLGKNLHYVHLGHCRNITDDAVKLLVKECNRIRYIDLGCCINLTDESVMMLATLPKLKRIGLVKCTQITDKSLFALASANDHRSRYKGTHLFDPRAPSLERVHLSYCTNLTLSSIISLLNCCPKLTHLSLTGVPAFLRDDLEDFCREAPRDFTEHQRAVFCVFSGQGVIGLRSFLNTKEEFREYHQAPLRPSPLRPRPNGPGGMAAVAAPPVPPFVATGGAQLPAQLPAPGALGLDDGDALEDDIMGDGSDLLDFRNGDDLTNIAHNPAPLPPPPPPTHHASTANLSYQSNGQSQVLPPVDGTALDATLTQPHQPPTMNDGASTAGSGLLTSSAAPPGPSTAPMQGNLDHMHGQAP